MVTKADSFGPFLRTLYKEMAVNKIDLTARERIVELLDEMSSVKDGATARQLSRQLVDTVRGLAVNAGLPNKEIVDGVTERIKELAEIERQIAHKLSKIDDIRKQMKGITYTFIYAGLQGNNDKQRDADLYVKQMEDHEYPALMQEEKEEVLALRLLEVDRDEQRRHIRLVTAVLDDEKLSR